MRFECKTMTTLVADKNNIKEAPKTRSEVKPSQEAFVALCDTWTSRVLISPQLLYVLYKCSNYQQTGKDMATSNRSRRLQNK
jgi:hypothetical protein